MGRVSRYKKIKSFDPFSKTGGVTIDPKADFINFAPKINQEEENKRLPKKMRELNFLMKKKSASLVDQKSSNPPRDPFSHIQALPGESMKSFRRRVNKELLLRKQENRQVSISSVKRIRDGRREYLEKKGLRKKLRKQGKQFEHLNQARRKSGDAEEDEEDYENGPVKIPLLKRTLKTTFFENGDEHYKNELRKLDKPIEFKTSDKEIAFGERVEAPPVLSMLPRKAAVLKQKFREKNEVDEQQRRAGEQKEYAKAQLAAYRAQVLEAYKAMKARNKENQQSPSSAITANRNQFLKQT